jgi:hypothetical protein
MNTKEILIEQSPPLTTKNSWFVALKNATDGVTARP